MSETRAALDRKIGMLEERARELSPRRYVREHTPEHLLDQAIGTVLLLIGARMAWSAWRNHQRRHGRVREAIASYGRW
jgi:hypothetical protein